MLLTQTFDSDLVVNFIKDILSNNNIEEYYIFKRIIESVEKF